MGPIAGTWLKAQTKLEILTVIETSQQQGVSARRTCSLLAIEHRRVVRWQQQARQGQPLANLIPGPKDPLHRILPAELDQIVTLARSQEYSFYVLCLWFEVFSVWVKGAGARPAIGHDLAVSVQVADERMFFQKGQLLRRRAVQQGAQVAQTPRAIFDGLLHRLSEYRVRS